MAISSNLSTLEGTPQKQATIYNAYLANRARVSQNPALSVPAKMIQLETAVRSAQDSLQALLEAANTAESAIRGKVTSLSSAGPASQVDATARANILMMHNEQKRSFQEIANVFIGQQDRASFAVLRSMLPILIRDERIRKETEDTLTVQEAKLYTHAEMLLLAEVYECDASMTWLRNNFLTLQGFFNDQLRPGVMMGGMFARPDSLYPWYGVAQQRFNQLSSNGVEWRQLSPDKILLVSDFDQVALANLVPTGGPAQQKTNLAAHPYLVTGPNSSTQWQDKPLKGMMP